jgi:hypothetical protein
MEMIIRMNGDCLKLIYKDTEGTKGDKERGGNIL